MRRYHPVSAAKFAEDETIAYKSVNPYDGKKLKTFEQLTDERLETALAIAETCFETAVQWFASLRSTRRPRRRR